MIVYLFLGMTYGFAAAAQPGLLQTYLISQAVTHGWRRALPAAFAPLLSDGPVIVVVLLVLARLPAWSLDALRCAGGLFVLYLGVGALRSRRAPERVPSKSRSLLRAAALNVLNPAPYIGWSLVMGPLLLQAWREAPARGIGLLAGFYAVLVAGSAATVLLFAGAGKLAPRVNRVLARASAAALLCFGVWLLWSGVSAWTR